MKAWRCVVYGYEDSFVCAETRNAARFQCWRAAREAGFEIDFGRIRVIRAHRFDRVITQPGRCWSEEFAEHLAEVTA